MWPESRYCSHPIVFCISTLPKFPGVFDTIEQWTLWYFRDLLGHFPRQGRAPLCQFCMAWFLAVRGGHRGAIFPFGNIFSEIISELPGNTVLHYQKTCHHFFFPFGTEKEAHFTKSHGSEQCSPSHYKSQCLLIKNSKTDKLSIGN